GTQTSFSDFLLFENDEASRAKIDDLTEVSCYVNAMNYGLERLEFFPLSLRLIREIHKILMNNAKGDDKLPGEFRSSQNWNGGSRPGNADFVPPPPEYLIETLDYFEKFLNQSNINMPALIKAALAHVQFETILPFQDGNGRLGRLLITLILRHEGILIHPLLYLSMYLKLNRQQYYDHLQSIPETGDWESWIEFFLTGVIETAEQGAKTIQTIVALFDEDRAKIRNSGKSTAAVLNIYNYLQDHPVSSTSKIRDKCELSLPTVLRSLITLEAIGIIREITGKERNKIFIYDRYFALLSQGAETL
ncbi:MAG: Fic family protein, partial [Rhodobacteraceae bacterium]|nr:Fic family protein [Paracoccaceae bacterium]